MTKRIKSNRSLSPPNRVLFVILLLLSWNRNAHSFVEEQIDIGRGPVAIAVPESVEPETSIPLVLLLHSYSGTSTADASYLNFFPLVEEFGFLFARPDGTTNQEGDQFWNANDMDLILSYSERLESEGMRIAQVSVPLVPAARAKSVG